MDDFECCSNARWVRSFVDDFGTVHMLSESDHPLFWDEFIPTYRASRYVYSIIRMAEYYNWSV